MPTHRDTVPESNPFLDGPYSGPVPGHVNPMPVHKTRRAHTHNTPQEAIDHRNLWWLIHYTTFAAAFIPLCIPGMPWFVSAPLIIAWTVFRILTPNRLTWPGRRPSATPHVSLRLPFISIR